MPLKSDQKNVRRTYNSDNVPDGRLAITKVDPTDRAEYECYAENSEGQSTKAPITVRVKGTRDSVLTSTRMFVRQTSCTVAVSGHSGRSDRAGHNHILL
jgi:hypothetical protein